MHGLTGWEARPYNAALSPQSLWGGLGGQLSESGGKLGSKRRGRHPEKALSDEFVRGVVEPGRYCDGHCLYLEVQPSGSRSWVQRIVIQGRRREIGLGGVPLVSLEEARARALANRKVARTGGDPVAGRRGGRRKGMPTFAAAAERVWRQTRSAWSNRKYRREWLTGLARYAFPRIGAMPVSEVTSAHLVEMLAPVWHERPTTARRVRQRVAAVMEWAVAMEYRPDNPCERIGPVLGRQQHRVAHMRALPHGKVAGAVRAVRASRARRVVKLVFEFLVLTAARSGEARGARWTEMDLAAGVWTVPAGRMKGKREHRVPLCRRALAILDAARALPERGPLTFPTARGRPLKDMALSGLLKDLGIAAVPHGFRSSFRDWAAEETDHPREVAEAALAHTVRNPVEAAYARSDLFERRRKLMEDWGAYLRRR